MSYLIVFAIVGLLIFVHELGHFLVARLLGMPIARFSVGMGRSLISVERGGVEYRLSVIPFGGYVLPKVDDLRSYFAQPVSARLLFALGGPAANVLAAMAGFAVFNVMMYGASFDAIFLAPVSQTMAALGSVVNAVPQLLAGSSDIAGLVGVVAQGGDFVGTDALLAVQFATVISLNLAVINMLPIPPLDGGKALLCLVEQFHEAGRYLHVPLNLAGLVMILGFLGYATLLDISRLLGGLLA